MDKHQEALDNLIEEIKFYGNLSFYGSSETLLLQELIDKYKKIKKAIQILKEHIQVYIYFGQSTIDIKDYDLIQEEYDLLKEVLRDE